MSGKWARLWQQAGTSRAAQIFLSTAFQQGQVLLSGAISFYQYGPSEYGRVALAMSAAGVLVGMGGLSSSVVSYRSSLDSRADEREFSNVLRALRIILLVSAGFSALFLCLLRLVSLDTQLFKSSSWTELLSIGLFVMASIYASFQQGAVYGRCDVRPMMVLNATLFFVGVPVCWVLIRELGLTGFFLANGLVIVARAAVTEMVLLSPFRGAAAGAPGLYPRLIHFMLPSTMASMTTLPSYWLASLFLYSVPGGASVLGLVALATSVKQVPLLICSSVLSSHGRPVFLNHGVDVACARTAYRKVLGLMLLLSGGLAIVFVLASILGLQLVSSGREPNLDEIIVALAAVFVLESINAVVYLPVTIAGAMWKSFWCIALPRDVSLVVLAAILTHWMGWPGFLVALVLCQVAGILLTMNVVHRDSRTLHYSILRGKA